MAVKKSNIVYLVLYRKIKRKSNGGRYVGHHSIMEVMKQFMWNFPHNLYYPIIKEMEDDKLLKKIGKTKYEIVGGQADNSLNKHNPPI